MVSSVNGGGGDVQQYSKPNHWQTKFVRSNLVSNLSSTGYHSWWSNHVNPDGECEILPANLSAFRQDTNFDFSRNGALGNNLSSALLDFAPTFVYEFGLKGKT